MTGKLDLVVDRREEFATISAQLKMLPDESLLALIEKAKPLHVGIDGKSYELILGEKRIFVKKIPLSDLELIPENVRSTANLYKLPLFCEYGIGAPGFGSWRELAANESATKWVLSRQCESFSLLYDWRVIAIRPRANPMTEEQSENLERQVQFWENSSSVRNRYLALHDPAAEIILFLEFVPQTLIGWLRKQYQLGLEAFDQALVFVETNLSLTIAFMKSQGLVHFDTHFENILTDGHRLYFNDFGLALSSDFDLNAEELNFLAKHQDYDFCRASVGFMHALIISTFGDEDWKESLRKVLKTNGAALTSTGRDLVKKYGPVALELLEFSQKLKNESKRTPYPAERLSKLLV